MISWILNPDKKIGFLIPMLISVVLIPVEIGSTLMVQILNGAVKILKLNY
jgi:hypothetical protein